jgi:heptosyltransferase III
MIPPAVDDAIDLSRIRRALVIKLRHHGDVLLASPVFTVLKRAAPHAEIDALVYLETAPMLERHPAISRLHTIDRRHKDRGPFAQLVGDGRLWWELRSRHYDLVVHLTEHPRGAWLTRIAGARWGVAPERARSAWLWRRCFTHRYPLPQSTPRHTVEADLDSLRRIGIWPDDGDKKLVHNPGPDAEARIADLLAANGLARRNFVLIHPGSRWLFKCWPAAPTAALLDRLAGMGWPVVMTGAPDPAEAPLVDAIKAALTSPIIDLTGQLTLAELSALIACARLFIGCDTAPMHLASAAGTPVVAWFGPSDERAWRPWRVPHRVVASSLHPCRPCGINGCGGSNNSDCLLTLPLDQAWAAVTDLLGKSESTEPQ